MLFFPDKIIFVFIKIQNNLKNAQKKSGIGKRRKGRAANDDPQFASFLLGG